MYKLFLLMCSCLLQACSSGGTSASLGQINFTQGGAYIPPPVMNTGLITTPVNTSDPNAEVNTTSNITYNLTRSIPDNNGPAYANAYFEGSWKPSTHLKLWGQTLTAPCSSADYANCSPATIDRPHEDVINALHQGWTGKDVNVLIEDSITQQHGAITGLLAYRYAPGANFYGLDIVGNSFATDVFFNQLNSNQTGLYGNNIKLGVVNQSYTANLSSLIGREQTFGAWTNDELIRARIAYTGSQISTINRMKDAGVSGQLKQFIFSDAVITKAAGNDKILSEYEPLNWFLAKDSDIRGRLLIVGALDQAGSVTNPSSIASYSNTAGNDTDVSSRFLLASGTTPFYNGQVAINGFNVNQGDGTSFAAPRVAGYVAIVRSKFPNLSASKTASILLETARYDTLACYKRAGGCDKAIYGAGEASLSRALAPVGKLR